MVVAIANYVAEKMLNYLNDPEREAFIKEVTSQCAQLKKVSSCRQISAIDRLIAEATQASLSNGANAKSTEPNTGSLAHSLQSDNNSSAAPTPSLTMEQNSPQSSSPPSANVSTIEEHVGGDVKTTSLHNGSAPVVQVEES
jgi:mRNA-binding protein PUF3